MTTRNQTGLLKAFTLFVLLGLSVIGCGGGGGGGSASTILAFTDDSGAPVPGDANFTGQVTGGSLTAARSVTPDAAGKLTINLGPGVYTAQAAYKNTAQLVTLTTNQNFTVVAGDKLKIQNIKLSDTDLANGWAQYRASNFPAALAAFQAYRVRAATGNFGSTAADNAIGWAQGHVAPNFNDSVAAFTSARTENGNNIDAEVGFAGILLARNAGPSDPQNAKDLLTAAIGAAGDYTSAPWHDAITEGDLYVSRALAEFIQGDLTAARADLEIVRPIAVTGTSKSGGDLFRTLDLLLKN